MRFLRRLFKRRPKPAPLDEQAAYAHSYGDRSGEILRVETAPVQAAEPPAWEDLTGELLRRAFETRLDARSRH